MSELLQEGGGTGKNLFVELFGNEIIGEDYFYVVGDNRELYGNFNSQFIWGKASCHGGGGIQSW